MAKAPTVAVRRPSITKQLAHPVLLAASEGVVLSRSLPSPVELPTIAPVMLHTQTSVQPESKSVHSPEVHVYAM